MDAGCYIDCRHSHLLYEHSPTDDYRHSVGTAATIIIMFDITVEMVGTWPVSIAREIAVCTVLRISAYTSIELCASTKLEINVCLIRTLNYVPIPSWRSVPVSE